jgi:hypothetical protein
MSDADIVLFVGGLLVAWAAGFGGGLMVTLIRKMFDQF